MIQEIYNYLWIRNVILTLSEEELETFVDTKENYADFVQVLSALMQRDDILVVFPEKRKIVSNLFQKYRFKYNTKGINEDVNYIVGRFDDYKSMSQRRIQEITGEFYADEFLDRRLPIIFKNCKEEIILHTINDAEIFLDMFTTINENEESEKAFSPTLLGYTSLINLLLARFPEFFDEKGVVDLSIINFMKIKDSTPVKGATKRYLKKTLKDLIDIKENLEKAKQKSLQM